mgnify:CR=1 FL=1
MNKKIKIIDLINMQYKNEKMPKNIRIKYSLVFDYYTYNEEIKWYETADKTTILDVFHKLDYEVEILEDNTEEIEELKRTENVYDMTLECYHDIEKKISNDELADKINEIIRYIKRKDKNND